MPAKIAVNGYGTIGKRVADAVTLQDDLGRSGQLAGKRHVHVTVVLLEGRRVGRRLVHRNEFRRHRVYRA